MGKLVNVHCLKIAFDIESPDVKWPEIGTINEKLRKDN